jgi:uncharacterized DUF497 family protein
MRFEWDEAKRQSNLEKHGFDFLRADEVLSGKHLVVPSRSHGAEQRYKAVGIAQGRFAAVIFTMRGESCRIISMRSARRGERKQYQALFG